MNTFLIGSMTKIHGLMFKINAAAGSGDALNKIKELLTWFFGAGAVGLIIVGVIQIAESMAESNGGQRTRGIMMILGGLLLGGAAGLVQLITSPPGAK